MIEAGSLDNVLGHLMFHKALIDEGRGAEKIDRYLGLLRSAEGEHQAAGGPLDRSLQMVFELVLSNDMDPWDVDLMKFAKLYGQRMQSEEVDFIVAGKIMHMAWSILRMQSCEVLNLNDRREELFFSDWDMDAIDQCVERALPDIDLTVPEGRRAERGHQAPLHPPCVAGGPVGRVRYGPTGSGDSPEPAEGQGTADEEPGQVRWQEPQR